jgi:hypothetical protein
MTRWIALTESLEAEIERLKKDMARRDEIAALADSLKDERAALAVALADHKREMNENQRDLYVAIERLQPRDQ